MNQAFDVVWSGRDYLLCQPEPIPLEPSHRQYGVILPLFHQFGPMTIEALQAHRPEDSRESLENKVNQLRRRGRLQICWHQTQRGRRVRVYGPVQQSGEGC